MSDAEDLFKKAGGLFSKIGKELAETGKQVGEEIAKASVQVATEVEKAGKQVTGLGRRTVRLELERTKVAPGDTLKGRVVLALTEPVEAKRLVVSLHAAQRTIEIKRQGRGTTPMSTRSEIFRFDQELGAAKSYENETLTFELMVPFDAMDKAAPAGAHPIADAVRQVASAFQPTAGPVEWSVKAALEISWGRDLAHEVDIIVAR
jgi:hypothetical protein|nr:hypothetical protein [Kofleriaceae bacterium]